MTGRMSVAEVLRVLRGCSLGPLLQVLDVDDGSVWSWNPRVRAALVVHGAEAAFLRRCVEAWARQFDGLDVDDVVAVLRRGALSGFRLALLDGGVGDAQPMPAITTDAVSVLLLLAEDLGVAVTWADLGVLAGLCHSGTAITIDPHSSNLAYVIAHELGHVLDFQMGLLPVGSPLVDRETLADDLGALLRRGGVSTAVEARRIALGFADVRDPEVDVSGRVDDVAIAAWFDGVSLSGWWGL